jgi:hypothetical protein
MQDVNAVIESYSGLSRTVLDYSAIIKRLIDQAKQPGFSIESWAPLAALVDTDRFVRVGNFKEVMDWQDYIGFLTNWAPNAEWECSFKRITENGDTVLLELEERTDAGGFKSAVNSLSVYEFGPDGKIHHVDIYLQMPMPDSAMLKGYEGIDIAG